ncbi:MAG TPA: phosphotransferase [Terriglobales bacterium]|nr:phosphotransferase [Terriglobales bacterium]
MTEHRPLSTISRALLQRIPDLVDVASFRRPLQVVQIGGAGRRGGRVHFAVVDPSARPLLFARLARDPRDSNVLIEEERLLRQLAAHPALQPHLAALVGIVEIDGQPLLLERAAPGEMMGRHLWMAALSRRLPADVAETLPILVALGSATRRPLSPSDFDAQLLEPLRQCCRTLGGDSGRFDAIAASLQQQLGAEPFAVLVHGDANPNNLLVEASSRRAWLIDWETAAPGLPLHDLMYFLSRYAYLGGVVPWGSKAARVRAFHGENHWAAVAARQAVRRYCEALSLPAATVLPLFQLHLLAKAALKWRTSGAERKTTRTWFELYRHFAAHPPVLWRDFAAPGEVATTPQP